MLRGFFLYSRVSLACLDRYTSSRIGMENLRKKFIGILMYIEQI